MSWNNTGSIPNAAAFDLEHLWISNSCNEHPSLISACKHEDKKLCVHFFSLWLPNLSWNDGIHFFLLLYIFLHPLCAYRHFWFNANFLYSFHETTTVSLTLLFSGDEGDSNEEPIIFINWLLSFHIESKIKKRTECVRKSERSKEILIRFFSSNGKSNL